MRISSRDLRQKFGVKVGVVEYPMPDLPSAIWLHDLLADLRVWGQCPGPRLDVFEKPGYVSSAEIDEAAKILVRY